MAKHRHGDDCGCARCPACSSTSLKAAPENVNLSVCRRCAAIFGGPIYLGDSYAIAGALQEPTGAPIRFYDLTVIGSQGVQRRHGWVEVGSTRVIQVG